MNNDLISRSELIKALNEAQVEFDEYYKGLGKAKVITDNAPTVTPDKIQAIMNDYLIYRCEPERPQGKWIYTPNIIGLSEYEGITCSICGDDSVGDFNFCPNCGADMRKGGTE